MEVAKIAATDFGALLGEIHCQRVPALTPGGTVSGKKWPSITALLGLFVAHGFATLCRQENLALRMGAHEGAALAQAPRRSCFRASTESRA
jgi:hypothetical protein